MYQTWCICMDRDREKIIEIGKRLYDRRLTFGTSGNISIRHNAKESVITGTGTRLGCLLQDDVVLISSEGDDIDGKGSSEKYLHTAIYSLREDVGAIIHVHSLALTAFSCARKAINQNIHPENILVFDDIPLAPYGMPSSRELVENTVNFFENRDVVLMANHGVVACGKDLDEAFTKIEMAEANAQLIINAQILGGGVSLNKNEVEDLIRLKNSCKH